MPISLVSPTTRSIPVTTVADFGKVCATNSTQSSSFATRIPTTTKPSGDCIIDNGTKLCPNYLMIVPFGTSAANGHFKIRILGWSKVVGTATDIWFPVKLLDAAECTLGTAKGLAGCNVDENQFIVDTIATVTGSDLVEVVSPADDTIAHLSIDTKGFELVEVDFLLNTAASMNALYREF